MHVLVVEDDASIRQLISSALTSEGWAVSTAADGRAALEQVHKNVLDAIVLDMQMPVMDGRTFFRALRALPSRIPVVVISAEDSRRAQRELGAEDSIEKPFDPDALIEHLRTLSPAGAS